VTNATPEPPASSAALKWTVVSVWFQPAALAGGFSVCVTTGARLSHFTSALFGASTLSALSTA
jgi:hypothetical protein